MQAVSDPPESAAERLFTIGGTGLAVAGMFNRSTSGLGLMLLGGALVLKGLQARKRNQDIAEGKVVPTPAPPKAVVVEREVVVERPVSQVYAYWRNLENLPRFMPHLVSVRELGEGKSSWVAKGPHGATVAWDSVIVHEERDEVIAWRSLPGATVQNEGAVYFRARGEASAEVRVHLEYLPPLGGLGQKAAQLLKNDPGEEVEADLLRFKALLEGPAT